MLSDNIEVSLPVLMRHVNDQRFSYVQESFYSGTYRTVSVGTACSLIVKAHVEVYRRCVSRLVFERPRSLYFIDDSCGDLEQWWKIRKGKTLAELQLEACEWLLAQKKPDYIKSDEDWAKARKDVEKLARQMRESKKPILREHHVQLFSK